jgi:uncharacterized membrane protein
MRRILFGVLMLAVLSAAIPAAYADGAFLYSGGVFTTLNVPGALGTFPVGINDAGQIVGGSSNGAFLYSDGVYTVISIPGVNSNSIEPAGINDVGQIVGTLSVNSNPGFLAQGFVYKKPLLTTINVLPPYETYANGINNLGQVVGISCVPDTAKGSVPCKSFLDSNGVLTSINNPAAVSGTFANGINDVGQIVGIYGAASENLGFIDTGGVFTTISFPDTTSVYATAINDTGQVVGNYCSMATTCQSFLDTDGVFTTISFPGASSTIVTGINNAGDMVGYYFQPPPTPEPGTAVLLLSGGLLFGLMMRKRIAQGLQQAT